MVHLISPCDQNTPYYTTSRLQVIYNSPQGITPYTPWKEHMRINFQWVWDDLKLPGDGRGIPKSQGKGWRFESRLWNLLSIERKTCQVVNCLLCFDVGLSAFCLKKNKRVNFQCIPAVQMVNNFSPVHIQMNNYIFLVFICWKPKLVGTQASHATMPVWIKLKDYHARILSAPAWNGQDWKSCAPNIP